MTSLNLTMRIPVNSDIFSGEASFARLFSQVNPEFVKAFKDTQTLYDVFREFVYAMDHLDEITKMPSFKSNKLLSNSDLAKAGTKAAGLFNSFATQSRSTEWRVVPVKKDVMDSMQEFFDRRYVTYIYLLMLRMCNSELEFTLDGNRYLVHISSETPHYSFALLEYIDVKRKISLRLPFLKERLREAIAMQY